MPDKKELKEWAYRWAVARRKIKAYGYAYCGVVDLAMLNYQEYLCQVFTYLYEQRSRHEKPTGL